MREQTTKTGKQNGFSVFRTMRTWFLWFVVSLSALIFLSWLSACIPKNAIRENLLESARYLLASEDVFYQIREGDRRTELHNYADATTLNILYSIDGEDRLEELFISPFYSDRGNAEKPVTELLAERIESEKEADTVYDRYWHGMTMVLRPLFLLLTIQGIRWVFLSVLVILFSILIVSMVKKGLKMPALFLGLAAISVQLPVTAFCIEYLPTVLIMVGCSVAVLHCGEKRERIFGICCVSGVLVAFFDFLTTETLAIVVPLAIAFCVWAKEGKLQSFWKEVKFLALAGVSWGMAYVGSYFVKWTLSSVILGSNRWTTAVESFFVRQGGDVVSFALDSLINGKEIPEAAIKTAGGTVLWQPLSAVMINLRLFLGFSGKISLESLALLLFFVTAGVAGVLFLFRKKEAGVLPGILLLLGLVPLVRMMVLYNHATVHCFFVYRAYMGTVFCLLTALWEVVDWNLLQRRKRK